MGNRKTRALLIAMIFAFSFPFSYVLSADSTVTRGIFGVKFGVLGGGYIKVDGVSDRYKKRASRSFGILLDYPIMGRVHFGIFCDIHNIVVTYSTSNIDYNVEDDGEMLLDVGAMFKYSIPLGKGPISLRPGLGGGYGILKNLRYIGNSNYWTFRATTEMIIRVGEKIALVADFGIWSAPSGGNDQFDVSSKAKSFIRFGLLF